MHARGVSREFSRKVLQIRVFPCRNTPRTGVFPSSCKIFAARLAAGSNVCWLEQAKIPLPCPGRFSQVQAGASHSVAGVKRGFVWAIGLIVAGGIAVRLAVILSPGFTVNADRAVVYLIALH